MALDQLERAARQVAASGTVTVLTGAGISTDSGIPDFRGPNGVWTKNPAAERMFTLQTYLTDPELRRRSWRDRAEHAAWTAQPNSGHRALVELERSARMGALVTQNIDGLHQAAGSGRVIEVHGTLHAAQCLSCGARSPMQVVLARVTAGEPDPPCELCGGLLKSATVSFGQALDPQVWRAAVSAARAGDLLLVAGSSLQVQPVASLCDVAVGSGARLLIMNAEATPYDALADVVVREPLAEAPPAVVGSVLARD
ncbi:MAG TPA: Sir2 family NAD-dependent protein deacetylase [Actinomycetes bacterium]